MAEIGPKTPPQAPGCHPSSCPPPAASTPPSDASSSPAASPTTVCAISAASSAIALWRWDSPTSSHNATAGAGLSASSRRNCTLGLLSAIIALRPDDTLKQRHQHPPCREQIAKRTERPGQRRLDRALQISPRGRNHQVAAVGQHHDQLQPPTAAHPAHQLKRLSLPRVTRANDPHPRREAIEVGSVSCLPLRRFRIRG